MIKSMRGSRRTWTACPNSFVVDEDGLPIDETTFSKDFREGLDAAGFDELHFHGLRKTAGRALADAGCSAHEIQAITDHKTLQMVELYTKAARQKARVVGHGEAGEG